LLNVTVMLPLSQTAVHITQQILIKLARSMIYSKINIPTVVLMYTSANWLINLGKKHTHIIVNIVNHCFINTFITVTSIIYISLPFESNKMLIRCWVKSISFSASFTATGTAEFKHCVNIATN